MEISQEQAESFLSTLKTRFLRNMQRHENLSWDQVQEKLLADPGKTEVTSRNGTDGRRT